MTMAEQAVGQAEDENEAEAATWSPRQRQWLDGVDTGPSAAVSEMQAVEDDLAWRLQSTLWCPPKTPVTAQGDMDDFVHEQTPVSGGTSRGDCQAESEEAEESELPEFIVQLEQVRVRQCSASAVCCGHLRLRFSLPDRLRWNFIGSS